MQAVAEPRWMKGRRLRVFQAHMLASRLVEQVLGFHRSVEFVDLGGKPHSIAEIGSASGTFGMHFAVIR